MARQTTRKLRTPLCDMLGIEYPILLAGMGGDATPPRLVAAVTNLGGLGVMGDKGGPGNVDDLDRAIREVKRLVGGKPFGVDLLLPATMAEVGVKSTHEVFRDLERSHPRHVAFVRQLLRDFNLPEVDFEDMAVASIEQTNKKLDVIFDHKVPVFAAALGDPAIMTERARKQGMKVIGMAGAVRHARRHVAAGVDIIAAQGTEAGGHTGNIATFVLVPQVVDAVAPRPVLAAGGIGSGRHVAAALALGAQGVWAGTLFLTAEETGIRPEHQQQILGARSEDFTVSKFSTGKQNRGFHNAIKEAWAKSGLESLPMPLQGIVQAPLNAALKAAGRTEMLYNPAGQVGGMLAKCRPAREIFTELVNDAIESIERLQRNLR
ncbi:MAG: nitronate monooxygenase [Chloroflexi bacterium]|nr:nitronate monooxygenase [Chloroflexota bacterium]